jgi:DNA-dependent RNA polymerase auxiliary subunit epsilon
MVILKSCYNYLYNSNNYLLEWIEKLKESVAAYGKQRRY